MNERIREIAEQAGGEFYEGFAGSTNFVKFAEDDFKKFAELIVKECATICKDVGNAVWAEPHQSNMGTAQTCKAAIEKHFGVEE